MTNNRNTNIQREVNLEEWARLTLRMDVLNPFDRTQMDPPTMDPVSTDFGGITQQSWTTKRYIQIHAKLCF